MLKLRPLPLATLFCSTLIAICAHSQTNLTQIQDTILNPNGTPFNGTAVITWNGYSSSGTGSISRLSASAQVYNGALSVLLVPTTNAAAGTYYSVVYSSSDGTVTWTEIWQVPPSSTPLTVGQVRQSSTEGSGNSGGQTTGGGVQYATLPVAISQITGLSSDLSTINSSITSLTGQVNTLAATVNSTGSLSSLQSTVTQLSGTVSTLNSTVSGLSTSTTSNTSAIATLNTTTTSLSNAVSALTATVNGLSAGGSSNAVFVDAETPGGTLNGTNAAFTLANAPTPSTSLALYRNGLLQANGVDFTLAAAAITFAAASKPAAADILRAYYRVAGTGAVANFVDQETPGGTINGTNLTFTLANAPNPAASLKLYKNGLMLTLNSDYSLSAATITFASASQTPQTGDILIASYRH
jgi:uncharacterized protein YoxC